MQDEDLPSGHSVPGRHAELGSDDRDETDVVVGVNAPGSRDLSAEDERKTTDRPAL